MAFLVNRNPAARFQCLHAMCRLIASRFSTTNSFALSDVKHNSEGNNIHRHCDLLISVNSLGIKHCPYKSPLDLSGCSLTNSVAVDTTKSKEVSNTINSLHGLGFVTRSLANGVTLTNLGKKFASLDFDDPLMHDVIREAVLNYGPMIGVLGQLHISGKQEFDTNEIQVGYPSTRERVIHNSESIMISSGSEADSNTRTRSCLLAWGTSAGFFYPANLNITHARTAHLEANSYINQEKRNNRKYKVLDLEPIFDNDFTVQRTLDYNNLTKNSKALRESNQAAVREATMAATRVIQNRRFCILYKLQRAFERRQKLLMGDLLSAFERRPDLYVISAENIPRVLQIELGICFTAGLILEIKGDELRPLNGINLSELSLGAPKDLLRDLDADI